jgi:hypothetical protein
LVARLLAPPHVTLEEGSPLNLIFETVNKEPIDDDCRFSVPGLAAKLKIFSGVKNEKYEFVGDGFAKGQCGLRLHSVSRINAGKVKCLVVLVNWEEQEFETEVTVLHPIEKLDIDSNSNHFYEYKENETMEFRCTAEGGYPTPSTLSLSMGVNIYLKKVISMILC